MHQRKNKIARWWGLWALILIVSVSAAVAPTFARYRTTLDPFAYLFQAEESPKLFLWGEGYTPLSGSWTVTAEGSELPIIVTNGSGSDYAKEDLTVNLRVAATEGIQAGNNLTLTLTHGDETYTAVPTAIGAGTGFYEDFGGGWIYRFLNAEGVEATWLLEGNQLSEISATLTCSGDVQLDSSMVQILATAVEG